MAIRSSRLSGKAAKRLLGVMALKVLAEMLKAMAGALR